MTNRRTHNLNQHDGIALDLDVAPFDVAWIDRIVGVVKKPLKVAQDQRDDIISQLNEIARSYAFRSDLAQAPTQVDQNQNLAGLRQLGSKARALFPEEHAELTKRLGAETAQDWTAQFETPLHTTFAEFAAAAGLQPEDLRSKIDAISSDPYGNWPQKLVSLTASLLITLGEAAKQVEATKALISHSIRDNGRTGTVADLAKVYTKLFGSKPGRSRNAITGTATGPYIRYLKSCFAQMGTDLTPEQIDSLIKRRK